MPYGWGETKVIHAFNKEHRGRYLQSIIWLHEQDQGLLPPPSATFKIPCVRGDGDEEVRGGNDSTAAPRFVYCLFIDHDKIFLNCLHAFFFSFLHIRFATVTFKLAHKQCLPRNRPVKAPIPLELRHYVPVIFP